jgi:hypothetical protein
LKLREVVLIQLLVMLDTLAPAQHQQRRENDYPLVPHEKIQAAGDDIFVFIWLKKWLPFQIGSGKELRILRDKGRHGLKLREVVLISVVGDAGTH